MNLSVAVLAAVAVLFVGCGSSSSSPGVAQLSSNTSSAATGDGAASPGSSSPETAALALAKCMRRHSISDFPDPRTTAPSNPRASLGGSGVISDIEGVILLFPGTIDQQSPLFTRAAAACAFPLHNH